MTWRGRGRARQALLAACLLGGAAWAADPEHVPMDVAAARSLVEPLYQALTASDAARMPALLERATRGDWQNCSTNQDCQSRADTLRRWAARVAVVPDLAWQAKEVRVSGSSIVVRGEATGTPVASFLGVAPQGRSFRIMTLDLHDTEDGRIVRTHHLEDWMGAVRQLSAPR